MPVFEELPPDPGAAIDWPAIEEAFDWWRRLAGCPQDPVFHAEGDVQRHTRLVAEALVADPAWAGCDAVGRRALFWAALLHDVAKPETTKTEEDGRVTARGHSARGAIRARAILWRLGASPAEREMICHLVSHHQAPLHLIYREAPERRVAEISWRTRCDWLAILSEADVRGRRCPDAGRLHENIELFRETCREQGCLDSPRPFASAHTRFLYFRGAERAPEVAAYDDTRSRATLLSGLPASGKDRWLAAHAGEALVIGLDAMRDELGVAPTGPQGALINAARERAREALREGAPLIWNATNLSRQIRRSLIDLFADYGARIRIVAFEAPEPELRRRNAERAAGDPVRQVPDKAIARMLDRWEAPDLTECHELQQVGDA